MIQFKRTALNKKFVVLLVCKVPSTFFLKQRRRAKHQDPFENLVRTIANFKFSEKDTFMGVF